VTHSWRMGIRVLISSLVLLCGTSAFAQPYGAWLTNGAPADTYIQLPNDAALNFAGGSFTFEAWVAISHSAQSECDSIAGNTFTAGQWIGICGQNLRSYMAGSGSAYTIGKVTSKWTHIAIVFDGATKTHTHWIDGEFAGSRVDSAAMTAGTGGWRIFHDAAWAFTPNGAIDEVRFWNVARTPAQIREFINQRITAPTTGLVAVYALDGNATDSVGGHHGTKVGAGGYLTSPIGLGCTSDGTTLCVGPGGRFAVQVQHQVAPTTGAITTANRVALSTSESGLFTFFSATNWEVMVKVLNGCGLNNRYWVFAAGTTNVHHEIIVTDQTGGLTRRYFNYAGPPAPAITDVNALASCP